MDLRHLRVFTTLAEELHFGRAARRLRVAQSAISQTLKALESEIHVTLLARTKRRVELTAAGEAFLVHARSALASVAAAAESARSIAAGSSGRVTLRFTTATALTYVPEAIARFRREAPNVHLDVGTASSIEQLELIRQRRCDFGFMTKARDVAPFASELVQRDPLVVLVPRKHRFATKKRIGFAELAPEELVFLRPTQEPFVHRQFLKRCAEAGFVPNIVLEVDQVDAMLAFVAAGMGIACVRGFVERLSFKGVVAIPIAPVAWAGVSVVWDDTVLSPTGARFLAVLREERERRQSRS